MYQNLLLHRPRYLNSYKLIISFFLLMVGAFEYYGQVKTGPAATAPNAAGTVFLCINQNITQQAHQSIIFVLGNDNNYGSGSVGVLKQATLK